jgi:hypothetical protein
MKFEDIHEEKPMSATEVAVLLSQTMRDVAERKITLRHAITVSRIAIALAKVIEVSNLKDRVEFLEQVLKKRK